jgi:hypothetical protein
MVVAGFVLVITIMYVSYVKVRRIEKKLEKFIRDDAIRNSNKTSGKK